MAISSCLTRSPSIDDSSRAFAFAAASACLAALAAAASALLVALAAAASAFLFFASVSAAAWFLSCCNLSVCFSRIASVESPLLTACCSSTYVSC